MAETDAQTTLPISELSSYTQRGWAIKGRVTNKAPLRTFSKGANTGKVFHVNLLDAQGGEIRASFFNEAADQHFEKLEAGKCFTFKGGSIKIANKQFNNLSHRYELSFDQNALVVEIADDAQIEAYKITVANLRSCQTKTLPCNVDLCGVITSAGPSLSFTSKEGKELVKRELTIADDSAVSMSVTLWGDRAKQEDNVFEGNPVIGLKGVVIKEFQGGRSGSLVQAGHLITKPTFLEAQTVQQWWSQGGSTQNLTSISQTSGGGGASRNLNAQPMNLAEMRRASEGVSEQAEHYSIVCRLAMVQTRKQGETQPLYYLACQEPKEGNNLPCNRRVDSSGFCATCSRAGKTAPRLNIRCRFADFGDSAWITTFHEGAQQVLDLKAEEVQKIENGEGGREALEAAISSKYFNQPLQVTLRAKMDSYNGEARSNITCVDARPLERGERGRLMLQEITAMLSATPGMGAVLGA